MIHQRSEYLSAICSNGELQVISDYEGKNHMPTMACRYDLEDVPFVDSNGHN
jgi:hypothetical protein